VHFFIIDRTTMLVLRDYKTKKILISVKILQELLLLLILYLFYIAELLEACNNTSKRLSTNKFINNISLLVYGPFMKCNCRILRAHEKCLDWARYYKILFNLKKYKLIHLSYMLYRFNMRALLQVGNKTLALKPLI